MKRGKREGKRIVIRPDFKSQIKMPGTAGLINLAEEKHLRPTPAQKRKGIKPKNLAAQYIMNRRMKVSMENTGTFFVYLCNALVGGILRRSEVPLFPDNHEKSWSCYGFSPDIVVEGDLRNTYIEVKGTAGSVGKANFSHCQYLRYSQAFLEDKGSEVLAAIFKYGGRKAMRMYVCKSKDTHKCDNRCLVKKLSTSTRSLLIIPHNLLTFLLMLSPSEERDHRSSAHYRFLNYKTSYGTYFTLLHKHHENIDQAIDEILKFAKSKSLGLGDFNADDFYLHDLGAKQHDAPRVYCRNRRIGNALGKELKPFVVTEYRTSNNQEWKSYFRDNFEGFVKGMGMWKDYQRRLERDAERAEAKKAKAELTDGIPI